MEGRASSVQKTRHQKIPDGSGEEASDAPGRPVADAADHHLMDASTLSATDLRKRYATTYSSWKNMKSRRGRDGAIIHPQFERFADFLRIVGPRPDTNYTLDRVVPSDPEYAPGKVRWLDKVGQAKNRDCTVILTHNGVEKPLSVWANETGQVADTLRSRRKNGWSHESAVNDQTTLLSLSAMSWLGRSLK